MAEDDALAVLVEFDHLEVELFIKTGLSAIFLNEVLGSSESFNAVGQSDNSAFFYHFDDSAFVYAANGEDCFKYIPGVFFELLVAE